MEELLERDLEWCAGTLDCFGAIESYNRSAARGPGARVRMRTPYRDRLIAIQRALGGLGNLSNAMAPTGHSIQEQYELSFTGEAFVTLWNLVGGRMRTRKREMFSLIWERKRGAAISSRLASTIQAPSSD